MELDNLESENVRLIDHVAEIENENHRLNQQVVTLEKALEKQKKFHRKFSDDVVESERVRNEDFKSQKRSLTETNKLLVQENRQLAKDALFYKKAFEELTREDQSARTTDSNQRPTKKGSAMKDNQAMEDRPTQSKRVSPRLVMMSTSTQASSEFTFVPASSQMVSLYQADSKQKSSKSLSKIAEKLFHENKKLKLKINNLSATVLILKKKIRQMENFIAKMTEQKSKVLRQVDELSFLVDSTKIKNKNTFNTEVLLKLNKFSE